jgi:peptide/nickel transport system ATP-binding protein
MNSFEPAVQLEDLEVVYRVRGIDRPVLRGLSITVGKGESYGLVGESGCGKTTAAFAIMRYLPRNGRVVSGSIRADGEDLLAMSEAEVRRLRASAISMVYQNPGAALNPAIRVGDQIAEVFRLVGHDKDEARDRAREMLRKVQIPDPAGGMRRYPHELSGGGQQRVVIAMALASDPTLLILDEPTTGLDATVEAEVLDLVAALRKEFGTSILFISHNLAVIRKMCERVGVLYAGRLVEEGEAETVFTEPRHPYTVGLLRCIPRGGLRKDRDRLDTIPGYLPQLGAHLPGCVFADRCGLVQEICRTDEPPLHPLGHGHSSRCHFHDKAAEVPYTASSIAPSDTARANGEGLVTLEHASKTFSHEGSTVRALVDVDLSISAGETLGLVGESGSGKTTLARVLLGLTAPDEGATVELDGRRLAARVVKRDREQVRALQTVFQNPDSALNRRFSVRRIIGRALEKLVGLRGARREERLKEIASSVRFDERLLSARPVQLSGGLKQRVAIARAFAGEPRVVVCDEPTSALDVSVHAEILNLLSALRAARGLTYLFVSHNLAVIAHMCERVAIMKAGAIVEQVPTAALRTGALADPYSRQLLRSSEGYDRAAAATLVD